MSNVYAPQCPMTKKGNQLVPKFDLSPTSHAGFSLRRDYGNLIWLLEPNAAPWSRGVFEKMRDGLKNFDGEKDYLLCTGNPVLMSMMAVFAGEYNTTLRFLQWGNGEYTPITVVVDEPAL
jgi:hypothetical protein